MSHFLDCTCPTRTIQYVSCQITLAVHVLPEAPGVSCQISLTVHVLPQAYDMSAVRFSLLYMSYQRHTICQLSDFLDCTCPTRSIRYVSCQIFLVVHVLTEASDMSTVRFSCLHMSYQRHQICQLSDFLGCTCVTPEASDVSAVRFPWLYISYQKHQIYQLSDFLGCTCPSKSMR